MDKPDAILGENAASARLERRVNQLARERGELFDRSGARFGLLKAEQERLHAIERELDECFLERRRMRAARDAQRFNPYARVPVRGREVSS
jgi:hypothetical protein